MAIVATLFNFSPPSIGADPAAADFCASSSSAATPFAFSFAISKLRGAISNYLWQLA